MEFLEGRDSYNLHPWKNLREHPLTSPHAHHLPLKNGFLISHPIPQFLHHPQAPFQAHHPENHPIFPPHQSRRRRLLKQHPHPHQQKQ
uniref:Uncharacterized protein n=1 Tax=Salix viminalis TaxID=40686 RepID=A0A6N2KFU4_SALVM